MITARVVNVEYKEHNRVPIFRADAVEAYVQGPRLYGLTIDLYATQEDFTAAGLNRASDMVNRIEQAIAAALAPRPDVAPTPPEVVEQIISGRKIILDP